MQRIVIQSHHVYTAYPDVDSSETEHACDAQGSDGDRGGGSHQHTQCAGWCCHWALALLRQMGSSVQLWAAIHVPTASGDVNSSAANGDDAAAGDPSGRNGFHDGGGGDEPAADHPHGGGGGGGGGGDGGADSGAARVRAWFSPALQAELLTMRHAASLLAHDMRNPLTLVAAMPELLGQIEGVPAAVTQQMASVKVRVTLCIGDV